MTRNIPTSSCWRTLRKETHTSFRLAIGWMRCCGLSTWVLPAKVTNNRFLQTWWLSSKSLRRKRGELLCQRRARTWWAGARQLKPAGPGRARACIPASGVLNQNSTHSGARARHSQRTHWSCRTNCHGPRFFLISELTCGNHCLKRTKGKPTQYTK